MYANSEPYNHARSKWYRGKALEVQPGELYSQYNSLWVMSFVNLNFYLGNSVSSAMKWK